MDNSVGACMVGFAQSLALNLFDLLLCESQYGEGRWKPPSASITGNAYLEANSEIGVRLCQALRVHANALNLTGDIIGEDRPSENPKSQLANNYLQAGTRAKC